MKSSIQLSDHFTYQKLLRFTIPSIVMMFFANLFNVIDDGFFVSNFVGKDAFVALNIMSPILTVFMALAIVVVIQGFLQSLLITAEKPTFAMVLTIISSASNIIFDVLLMVVFPLGITGAICATLSGPAISGAVAVVYFATTKKSKIHFVKTKIRFKEIGNISRLGVSQLITNLAISIVSMVFNAQLMKYQGNDGVAAYGVIMYVSIVFTAAFTGYSTGATSIVAYHFGAKNREEMQNVNRKSLVMIGVMSVLLTVLSYLSARPFASVIVGYDADLLEMSVYAYRIYGFSFLFAGIGVFAGAFFTALNDSFTAGAISFIRTMVFQVGTVLLMPLFMDMDGIWYAPVAAEVLSALVAVVYLKRKKEKYQY